MNKIPVYHKELVQKSGKAAMKIPQEMITVTMEKAWDTLKNVSEERGISQENYFSVESMQNLENKLSIWPLSNDQELIFQRVAIVLQKIVQKSLDIEAPMLLGWLYQYGIGVPVNMKVAKENFYRAACFGNQEGFLSLAQVYAQENDMRAASQCVLEGTKLDK